MGGWEDRGGLEREGEGEGRWRKGRRIQGGEKGGGRREKQNVKANFVCHVYTHAHMQTKEALNRIGPVQTVKAICPNSTSLTPASGGRGGGGGGGERDTCHDS